MQKPISPATRLSGLGNSPRTAPTAHSTTIWVVVNSAFVEAAARPELVGKS